jgi:hypothetical protein
VGGLNTDGCETGETSILHCGACGQKCVLDHASAATCDGTKCAYTCDPGFVDCNNTNGANLDGCETAGVACPPPL